MAALEFGEVADGEQAPVVEDRDALADALDVAEDVGGEQDR